MSSDATQPCSATHIGELLDLERLDQRIADGYVKVRSHPTLPFTIYNYAEKTVYEREWDAVTSQCRGLIVFDDDGTVLARPWPKFFNLGEHPENAFDLDAPVEVTDKADGSLGILVQSGEPFIATRGSFESEQAGHATDVYRDHYHGAWEPNPALTYLFEIVYPQNRIVLDYGDLDDLILLGAVHIATGATLGPGDLPEWPGLHAEVFAYRTLREALEAKPRANAEGVVVRFPETHVMLKLKQQDYLELHRIITGLNARVVWEHAGRGDLAAMLDVLPDEFQTWAINLAADLNDRLGAIWTEAERTHNAVLAALPEGWTRKDYAQIAVRHDSKALLFQLLDGKSPREAIWRTLRPSGDLVPRYMGEDVA